MKIPVGDRMKSASISPDFLQSILNALTPIQIANAFPNYYKRQLPDVSNFITSYITSRNGGNFNQTGGGDDGSASPFYDGEDKKDGQRPLGAPEPTIEEMKKKLLEKGIDVDGIYNSLGTNGLSEDDPILESIKGMKDDQLSEAGLQRITKPDGSTIIVQKLSEAAAMTDEQILQAMAETSGKVTAGEIRTSSDQASYYDKMYNAVYKAAVEKGVKNPEVIARLGATQTALETGYGKHMVGNNAFGVKANKGGPSVNATTKEYINGQWVTIKDNFRQYASPEESAADYVQFLKDNKRYEGVLAAGTIEEAIVAQGKTGYATDPGYENKIKSIHDLMSKGASSATINKDMTEILKTATPEDIEKFRDDLKDKQQKERFNNLVKNIYDKASPTSSEFPASKDGETRVSIEGEKLRPVGTDYDSLKEFWSQRNPRTDINRVMEVDPDLLKAYAEAVQQYEAANPGLKVELFGPSAASRDSGSTSNHGVKADGYSKALDFAIIDRASGKQITNLGKEGYSGQVGGSEVAAREYTRLHSLARIAQEHYAPHESNLRQGGGFVQGVTADWMHGDIQSENMAAYSWEKGYDPNFRRQYNIQENLVLGKEERIKELGQQIYGQVDESGYYTNRADFSQLEDGNTTVVSKKVEKPKDDIVASAQPEASPVVATPPVSPPVETAATVTEQTPVAATQPVPVDSKETPVVVTQPVAVEPKEVTVAAATPAEPKETTAATPPPPPEDVRKFALGGNIYEPNEDMTLVDTETGNPIAQIGNDEKIEKTGNAIQVTPETKLKADELTNKYDSSTEMEDRMANIEDNMQSQQSPDKTNQVVQKAKEPEKAKTDAPYRWRESLASAERPVSPSFNRAMARSKFFGEGHHFNRSAPGSQS